MTMIIDEIKLIQDWFGQQGETGVGGFEEKGVWRGYKVGFESRRDRMPHAMSSVPSKSLARNCCANRELTARNIYAIHGLSTHF